MAITSPLDIVNAGMQATLKSPIIGKTDDQVRAEADALDTAEQALAQRYAQPNWFNVAAGFLKPQLGGFGASLGSAAQALGENLEKQRENELPLYAVRAQVGAMKSQMANRQLAAKAYEDAKKGNFAPEGLPALQATLTSYGAPELADSIGKMIETRQKDRSLDTTAQQLLTTQMAEDRALLTERRKQNLITEEQYNQGLADIFNRRQERPKPTVPGTAGADIVAPEVKAPAAPTVFKPLDPKADLTYDNLTPEQKTTVNTSVNKMLEANGLRTIMGTDTGKESWNTQITKLKKENPEGLATFIDAINSQGVLSSNPTEVPTAAKAPASPAAKAPAPAAVAPATTTPTAAAPKEFVYKDNYALPHKNPMTADQIKENESTKVTAAKANVGDENYYNAVKAISQPTQYKIADDANNFIIDQFKKNPKDVKAVMDLVRKAGGFAAMVNQGLGISFNGPFAVNVAIPVETGLIASLSDNQRTLFDAMAQSAATSAYFNMKQRGVDPEKAGIDKFGAQMQQEIGLKQTPGALFLAANKNAANLHMAKEAADIFDKELPKVKGYYAPHLEIRRQSPEMFKLEQKYDFINKAHNKAFNGG
jgi:hypothetical protein